MKVQNHARWGPGTKFTKENYSRVAGKSKKLLKKFEDAISVVPLQNNCFQRFDICFAQKK